MEKKRLAMEHHSILAAYGLKDIPLCSCTCACFKSGETILREGLPITCLFIIVTGRVKVCSAGPNGKNLVLCYYVSEGILGDIEFITGQNSATATIMAITDVQCLAIPCHKNKVSLKQNITFMNRLAYALAIKLQLSSSNYTSAALNSCEERLCSYILQASHNGLFNDILTDTACSVGMSYRHMLRILNQLCIQGFLLKDSCGYRILDRDALVQKASGKGNS